MGRTLREHFLSMYKPALDGVIAHINKRGYISDWDTGNYLQKEIDRFERYYVKKHKNLDPFSDDFVHLVFNEFLEEHVKKTTMIKIIRLSDEEQRYVNYGEIYGFDESVMLKAYRKVKKRKKQEHEKDKIILEESINKTHGQGNIKR